MTFVKRTPSEPRHQQLQDKALYDLQRKVNKKAAGHKHPHLHTEYAAIQHSHPVTPPPQEMRPSIKLYGFVSPTPFAPGFNSEYGLHWQSQHYNRDTNYFRWIGGGSQYISVLIGGLILIDATAAWAESNSKNGSTRILHVSAGGQVVLDDHRAAINSDDVSSSTTAGGSCQAWLNAGDVITTSVMHHDNSAFPPTFSSNGLAWPQITCTWLGP